MNASFESQSAMNGSRLGIVLGIITVLAFVLPRLVSVQKDPREPPFLPAKIPLVGHLLGIIRDGADYYQTLQARYHQDIYTLSIFKGRLYMVSSPEWSSAIQKSYKTLHFNTLIAQAMKNLFCMDDEAMKVINENLNGQNGTREGIMLEVHDMMGATLAPGKDLDDLNKSILDKILPDINALARGGPANIKLWEWLRHHFAVASVSAIWGPNNPFVKYPEVEPAFWTFEANAMPLSMMPAPQILARKGFEARKLLFDSWEEYMENEEYKGPDVSQLIKNRAKVNMGKYGLTKKMHAFGDVSLLFGALLNTIPTAFWLVSWIFEDPKLLAEIRAEVDQCIMMSSSDSKRRTINSAKLRNSCPLVFSTFRETLRLVGSVNSNRYVAEDTTVTNNATGESYLLKKDSVVQIASNVIHYKPLWGSDATSFNPRRFMAQSEKSDSAAKRPDPAAPFRDASGKVYSSAYRSFGGGNNICPGRHFAQTEVMGLASLLMAGFEIQNVGGSGEYKMPPYEDYKLMMGVIKPGKDVDVQIRRRKGYEEVEWAFEMSE